MNAFYSAVGKSPLEQRIWISHKGDMQASSCPRRIGMEGHLLTLSFERHVTSMIWADSLDFNRYCLTARLQMKVSGVSGKIMLDVVDT